MTDTLPTPAAVRRILTWPIGPAFLVGRSSAAPRAAQLIDAADLPEPIKALIRDIVRRTRLWHSEQADVSRELIAHFEDALASGETEPDAIQAFGEPRCAARLIRRARRRGRGIVWHTWQRSWQTAAVLLLVAGIVYGFLALRYYTAVPVIARNYAAELSRPALAIPEDQRAWPLYRQAYLSLDAFPDGLKRRSEPGRYARPGEPGWDDVAQFLDRHADALATARAAAGRPALGWSFADGPDPDIWAHDHARAGRDPEEGRRQAQRYRAEQRPLFTVVLDLHVPNQLALVLAADARHAADQHDAQRASDNIAALIGLASHLRQTPLVITDQVAFGILSRAAGVARSILHHHPDLLSDEQLRDLAHVLAAFDGGGALRPDLASERALAHDFIQHIYSDDGRGGGHLTARGAELLASFLAFAGLDEAPIRRALDSTALAPLSIAMIADRASMTAEVTPVFDAIEAEIALPPWQWHDLPGAAFLRSGAESQWVRRYPVIATLLPRIGRASQQAVHAQVARDTTLVAIALELHRRRHAEYPESLESLTPSLLPAVPLDPFDGQPLRYRLTDAGRPLVYSIGANRTDDGGIAPPGDVLLRERRRIGHHNALTGLSREDRLAPLEGDWVLWPPGE